MALCPQGPEDNLRDNRTNLTGSGRQTVRRRAVPRGETFTRYNKRGGVGAEVEEELAEDIQRKEGVLGKFVVGEADNAEEDGEDDEAHQLDGLAADGVDRRDGDPVARDGAGADDDQVADGGVAEDVVDVGAAGVADCG